MTTLDRAEQFASEISDRVYRVQRHSRVAPDYETFEAILNHPGGDSIFIAVSSTNTWEIK